MKAHSIRPTKDDFGFIIDDEIAIHRNKYGTYVIHLNKGPKKPEDYKDYQIPDRYTAEEWIDARDVIINERVCIDIVFLYNTFYMRGFIINILESDLDIIPKCDIEYPGEIIVYKKMGDIKKYLKSIFGTCFSNEPSTRIIEIYGLQLFEKEIYANSSSKKFWLDLSDITLKDDFDQLIKANVDKIKEILFPNDIPKDTKHTHYSTY